MINAHIIDGVAQNLFIDEKYQKKINEFQAQEN